MAEPSPKPSHHTTTADIAARQVAAVYAKALLGATEKNGTTDAVVAELDQLITDVLDRHPAFEQMLVASRGKNQGRSDLIDRVFTGRATPLLVNFLKVLSRHGRLGVLRAVRGEVHRQLDVLRGRVRIEMETATPVENGAADGLLAALRPLVQGQPLLERSVDPSLIGGMVLRIGDTLFDGSVARQLQRVREKMIQRSVHEIQSRRDRFRNTNGN